MSQYLHKAPVEQTYLTAVQLEFSRLSLAPLALQINLVQLFKICHFMIPNYGYGHFGTLGRGNLLSFNRVFGTVLIRHINYFQKFLFFCYNVVRVCGGGVDWSLVSVPVLLGVLHVICAPVLVLDRLI